MWIYREPPYFSDYFDLKICDNQPREQFFLSRNTDTCSSPTVHMQRGGPDENWKITVGKLNRLTYWPDDVRVDQMGARSVEDLKIDPGVYLTFDTSDDITMRGHFYPCKNGCTAVRTVIKGTTTTSDIQVMHYYRDNQIYYSEAKNFTFTLKDNTGENMSLPAPPGYTSCQTKNNEIIQMNYKNPVEDDHPAPQALSRVQRADITITCTTTDNNDELVELYLDFSVETVCFDANWTHVEFTSPTTTVTSTPTKTATSTATITGLSTPTSTAASTVTTTPTTQKIILMKTNILPTATYKEGTYVIVGIFPATIITICGFHVLHPRGALLA